MAAKARTVTITELDARRRRLVAAPHATWTSAAFGINAWSGDEAGAQLVGEHDEERSGPRGAVPRRSPAARRFTVDGEETRRGRRAPSSSSATLQSKRAAVADEDGTTLFAVGAQPDAVFRPRAWETNASVFPLFGEDEVRRGEADALTDALDALRGPRGAASTTWRAAEARLGRDRGGDRAPRASASRCGRRSPSWRATTSDLDAIRGRSALRASWSAAAGGR